jgi:hypothetical protein
LVAFPENIFSACLEEIGELKFRCCLAPLIWFSATTAFQRTLTQGPGFALSVNIVMLAFLVFLLSGR